MPITKDQIFAVADELDQAGLNPTLAAVRKQLGSGSYTTISEAMNEWRTHKSEQAASIREPVPEAITERLADLGADVWTVAMDLANKRLAAERETLETVRAETEAAREEAVELADQLTGELDAMKAQIDTLKKAEAIVREQCSELREKLAQAMEWGATADARASELRTELDHAHTEIGQMREEVGKAREEAATLRGRIEGQEGKKDASTRSRM